MRENVIEQYLKERVERLGGKCLKFESPGYAGVPDRIIVLPGGRVIFAETKAPGKMERPLQQRRAAQLRALGCTVWSTVDSRERVDGLLSGSAPDQK